jgi:hypothetical protein
MASLYQRLCQTTLNRCNYQINNTIKVRNLELGIWNSRTCKKIIQVCLILLQTEFFDPFDQHGP